MMPRHVILFAREPRFGAVKSRLAADIGEGTALAFYKATLRRLARRLSVDPRWTTWLAVTPPQAVRRRAAWHHGARVFAQSKGDLGRRMAAAFRHVPPGPAVLVGSDIPDLGPNQIAAAFRRLADHDAVFGPTDDGGFYLAGFSAGRRLSDPFGGVRWSTPHALADTLGNLAAGARAAFVEELTDIDTGDDLARWRAAADSRYACSPPSRHDEQGGGT